MTTANMQPLWSLLGQAELPPSVVFGEDKVDLWPYRRRTVAMLHRYARCSVEVGRLPSLLGREFFRARVTSYTLKSFEDVVIFVTDMELAIDKLTGLQKKLLAMNVIEEYTREEIARLLNCNPKTIRRLLHSALDQLTEILLAGGLLEKLPLDLHSQKSCQGAESSNFRVSGSIEYENKCERIVRIPPSDLIS